MADQQSSELLQVLGQLGDAAWGGTLLPLLRANKSAGAVALACKQLQRLCHGNQRELKLTGANCEHLDPLELEAFSRRFPACRSVAFTASSANDVTYTLTSMVPLLSRLPKLQSLQLIINSWAASQPAHMVPALQLLRLQLPQLRSLQLELAGSWGSDSEEAWKMLGTATQLTKLVVTFRNNWAGDPGPSLQHLPALRPLGSSLQHLELAAERINIMISQDCSFLSSFSGPTSLELPVINQRSGLAATSSCTALQQLRLKLGGASRGVLDAAECAALAQLTRLTLMDIPPSSHTPALLAALRCLSGLQSLRLDDIGGCHPSGAGNPEQAYQPARQLGGHARRTGNTGSSWSFAGRLSLCGGGGVVWSVPTGGISWCKEARDVRHLAAVAPGQPQPAHDVTGAAGHWKLS